MASSTSLVSRLGFGAQTAKGVYPTTNIQLARAISIESAPEFDVIENINHMLGLHERSSARQSVAERSSVSVPLNFEVGLYPRSLAYLLFGIGFVPATAVTVTGVSTHKLVKSNVGDAPYLTVYDRNLTGASQFSRQIQDVRLSEMVITQNRTTGVTARCTGMGLNETVVEELDYTVVSEVGTQFLPFLGGMLWDTTVNGDFDFGIGREHVITITREIDEEDQMLHEFTRNDNQELSFDVAGTIRGLDMSINLYKELIYGGVASIYDAAVGVATVLTGLTIEFNTSRTIPAGTPVQPYKFILNVPKAQIRFGNFRAAGNEIVRAEVMWEMIDEATTPPVRIELTNATASYPYNNALFVAAGGTAWTLPDATP